jgi:hypothetical protein
VINYQYTLIATSGPPLSLTIDNVFRLEPQAFGS